ncbi:MAG: hypothetical protein GXP04_09645 [Alphaproteobacteria bacterium]|nr:hypothetical protein [Alphaproteobacteria bacterium]
MTVRAIIKINLLVRIIAASIFIVANTMNAAAHPPPTGWGAIEAAPGGGVAVSLPIKVDQCTNSTTLMIAGNPHVFGGANCGFPYSCPTWGEFHQEVHILSQEFLTAFNLPTNDQNGMAATTNANPDWFTTYAWAPIDPALPVECTVFMGGDSTSAYNTLGSAYNNASFDPATWDQIRSHGPIVVYQPATLNTQGMTWKKLAQHSTTGTVTVGCGSGNAVCDPYNGDQMCTAELPVLCFKEDSSLTKPNSVTVSKYRQWANGVVATTSAVSPANEYWADLSDADAYCATEFGGGWKVASFHQGWGWNFQSYGNTGSDYARFWVNISDQQNGNCWISQN